MFNRVFSVKQAVLNLVNNLNNSQLFCTPLKNYIREITILLFVLGCHGPPGGVFTGDLNTPSDKVYRGALIIPGNYGLRVFVLGSCSLEAHLLNLN